MSEASNFPLEEPNASAVVPSTEVPDSTFDEPFNTRFSKGEHIILELSTGDIFEGDYADGGRDRIDLVNTKQYNNENALGGVYSFYRSEIDDVYLLKTENNTEELPRCRTEIETRTSVEREEYCRLEKMAKYYVYINRADDRYYKAIKAMNRAENIGIAAIGIDPSRNSQIKLLAVATWKEVYLFDFLEHRQRYFYPELKGILEYKYSTKVFHGGSLLVDMLNKEYKITIRKTFDIEIVDLLIQKKLTGECPDETRDLSECINYYLGLPMCLVKNALEPSKKWDDRPLCDDYKLYAAQLVTYLIILKKHMQKVLLSDTYNTINKVLDFYMNNGDSETDSIPDELRLLIPSFETLYLGSKVKKRDSFDFGFEEIGVRKSECSKHKDDAKSDKTNDDNFEDF